MKQAIRGVFSVGIGTILGGLIASTAYLYRAPFDFSEAQKRNYFNAIALVVGGSTLGGVGALKLTFLSDDEQVKRLMRDGRYKHLFDPSALAELEVSNHVATH